MQEMVHILDDVEKMKIGDELTRLFALQDMAFGKEKKAIFVAELSATGLPTEAIVRGIRSMVSEDLKSIKLNRLIEASRPFVYQDTPTTKCAECLSGFVVMHDEQGYFFSFACRCPAGQIKRRSSGLVGWVGEESQFSNGRLLTKS